MYVWCDVWLPSGNYRNRNRAHGTDKALGKPQLSRPLTRAAATPSTGVCAPPMCRHPCTSALTRMLACHMRLCFGRLFYTLKGYGVEFIHPEACLVVLVAGQRSQASLSARGAVNVLLTRAAMAVGPPWGIVLLRPGPPGPMPTFYTLTLAPLLRV